jgi:hypothetical protein
LVIQTHRLVCLEESTKGQIILTRTLGTTFPKIMTVTFNNFYINENKLEGTSTWKREMIGTELICIQNTLP